MVKPAISEASDRRVLLAGSCLRQAEYGVNHFDGREVCPVRSAPENAKSLCWEAHLPHAVDLDAL